MATLTRAQFLANLRTRLNDNNADNVRWTDEELLDYLQESVDRYSKVMPRVRDTQFTADGVLNRFDVPEDLLDKAILNIWSVSGATRVEIPSAQFRTWTNSRYWEVIDEQIVFAFTPSANVTMQVRYRAIHTLPDDDTTVSTVPTEDYDLIYLWATCLAWRRIGGNDAALSRWTEGQKRDDSPLIPHHVLLERQYTKLMQEKKAGGRQLVLVKSTARNRLSDRFLP